MVYLLSYYNVENKLKIPWIESEIIVMDMCNLYGSILYRIDYREEKWQMKSHKWKCYFFFVLSLLICSDRSLSSTTIKLLKYLDFVLHKRKLFKLTIRIWVYHNNLDIIITDHHVCIYNLCHSSSLLINSNKI